MVNFMLHIQDAALNIVLIVRIVDVKNEVEKLSVKNVVFEEVL